MGMQLMEIVLPRLAQRLQRQLKHYRAGRLNDDQFTERFESLLQRLYAWLAKNGVAEPQAALAIHAAVLVLSGPGLRAEAEEQGLPLEVIEQRALKTAASDLGRCYGVDERKAIRKLAAIVAAYGD
jgi:hypothetical protein